MKKVLVLSLFIISNFLYAGTPEYYEFSQLGSVKLEKLEKGMSPGFSYAKVDIISIRKAASEYHPIEVFFGSPYDRYVVKILLNKVDSIKCNLVNILDSRKFMLTECKGETTTVEHDGFIYFKDAEIYFDTK